MTGAALLLLAAAGCTAGDAGGPGAAPEPPARPLVASAGDQGSFSTPCGYSHSGPDDPIVHPGHAGASHRHDFFGATTTGAGSTAETLLAGGTTCRSVADRSAYWAPALLVDGRPVEPLSLQAYYRVPLGADATQVEPPPNGLELIAGDATATAPQDPEVVAWSCGLAEERSPTPVPCPQSPFLLLRLRFPPCWDGEDLRSDDHRSHVAPVGPDGTCPDAHPVLLPQLQLDIRYPPPAEGATLALASGPVTGGHGDALLAWDEAHIAGEVELCLRANRNCDVTSETARLDVTPPGA
ncbi:MAG TPA: DUF1996 domain-containing protein [Acidimicrobiales bacterium]